MQDLSSLWNPEYPPDSLRRYAEALNEHARATFLESGTHVPLMFLFKKEGLAGVLPLVGSTDKDQIATAVRGHIRSEGIYAVIHIAEGWAYLPARKNDHTFKQIAQGEMSVSDLKGDDKSEVLMLHMSSRDGASQLWLHPITRANGKASLSDPLAIDGPASGPFGNLF